MQRRVVVISLYVSAQLTKRLKRTTYFLTVVLALEYTTDLIKLLKSYFSSVWVTWLVCLHNPKLKIFYKIKRNWILQCCLRFCKYYKMYFNLSNMQHFHGPVTITQITVKRPIKLQWTITWVHMHCPATAKGRPVTPNTFHRIFCK